LAKFGVSELNSLSLEFLLSMLAYLFVIPAQEAVS